MINHNSLASSHLRRQNHTGPILKRPTTSSQIPEITTLHTIRSDRTQSDQCFATSKRATNVTCFAAHFTSIKATKAARVLLNPSLQSILSTRKLSRSICSAVHPGLPSKPKLHIGSTNHTQVPHQYPDT